ncbi:MAG: tyrosine-type recombinase/integrase [Bacteroidales bacterium]|nr:tyrosine-type recombinase/integrase [Bacteroidales bacterium]
MPSDLQTRFNKKRVVISLRTLSEPKALKSAIKLADRLETYWSTLRLELFHTKQLKLSFLDNEKTISEKLKLSDALNIYLKLKGKGKDVLFARTANRNISYAIECFGDIDINLIKPIDSGKYRDFLFNKGLSASSVRRIFSSISAVFNISINEVGINMLNPFSGTYIPDDNKTKIRLPIPIENIRSIQAECKSLDDDNRWLIALISDTGMRLSEAVGLLTNDIILDAKIPHINLVNHPWRRLKTKGSNRVIPLIGSSLWAAKRVLEAGNKYAFPRYTNEKKCNANSASNGLNKWLKPRTPNDCVIHSFRHSLRDRLRAVQCPSDIVDAIGGWSTNGVGQSYGSGYNLQVKYEWLNKI